MAYGTQTNRNWNKFLKIRIYRMYSYQRVEDPKFLIEQDLKALVRRPKNTLGTVVRYYPESRNLVLY